MLYTGKLNSVLQPIVYVEASSESGKSKEEKDNDKNTPATGDDKKHFVQLF
jgi:hypothetical protein